MNPRLVILLAIATVAAGGSIYTTKVWLAGQRAAAVPAPVAAPAPPPAEVTEILVARTDLPAGRLIRESDLDWRAWPDDALDTKRHVTKDQAGAADFAGTVVKTGIVAGEPIIANRLVRPGERGFLAAVLTPDKRAVTIAVNATTALAGLVFAGDRVDVLLTQDVPVEEGPRRTRLVTETVLTDVRVLAVDEVLDDLSTEPRIARNVTLEVSPKQAEILSVVVSLGRLSLTLRGLARAEDAAGATLAAGDAQRGTSRTWDTEVSGALPSATRTKRQVQVVRGSDHHVAEF